MIRFYTANNKQFSSTVRKVLFLSLVMLFSYQTTYAATITSNATGNWNTSGTWVGGTIPGAGDDVIIASGHVVTVNGAFSCNSLTINVATVTTTVVIGANSLNVGSGAGNVVINAPTAAITASITLTTGSLTCGNITIGGGGAANWIGRISMTGAATVNCTNVAFTGTAAQAQFVCAASSFLKIGGTGTLGTGGTFTKSTGTVEFTNLSGGQTLNTYSYHHLKFDNTSGTNTAAGNIDATGTITTTAGGTFDMSTYVLSGAFTAANSGTFSTSNTSAAPVTTGKTWGGTFIYASTTGGQTVMAGTYNHLTLLNSGGTNTVSAAITAINGTFTTTAGGTFAPAFNVPINGDVVCGGTMNASAGTITYGRTTGNQNILSGTYNSLTQSNTSNTNPVCGNIVINNTLTTAAGGILDLSTYTLSGTLTTITNNGTISTSNTSTAPLPTGKTWTGTIRYALLSGGQTIMAGTYTNLTLLNTSGVSTASGAISASGTLTTTAGGTFDMSTFALSGTFTAANSGTFTTSNTSATPVTTGKSWGGTFIYALSTGGQTVMAGTYNNLTVANSSNSNNASGALTVNGTLTTTTGGTLNMSTFALGGTLSTITNDGTIQTANTTATPLPTGKTWGGTINYTSTSAQTVATGTYNNLILSGALAKTLGGDVTVNGMTTINGLATTALTISNRILTLNGGLTVTSGTLVGGNTSSLVMGATATLPSSLTALLNLTLNAGTTTLSGPLTLVGATNTTGILTLNGGILETSISALLSVNNRTTGAIVGGSSTSFVDGPLQREFALNQTGTNAFPVGDGGRYLPFSISSLSLTAGTRIRIQAFDLNSGGSNGTCINSMSLSEYWSASFNNGTYTNGSVSMGRPNSLGSLNVIARSSTALGTYDNIGGTVSGNNVNNSDLTGNTLGFFVLAEKTITAPTISSPSSTNITVTTADLGGNITSLGCAKVTERGIVYSTTNGFDPTISGTTVAQTPGPYATGAFTLTISGLTISTTYYFVAYAKSSDGTTYTTQSSFTTRTPKIYYVNDNSTTGDVFTTAVGNNAAGRGQTTATPKLTLTSLLSEYNASFLYGDTIKIDAGMYNNEVSLNFAVSGITFLGAGNSLTIIDNLFGGTATNYFMYVTGNHVTFRDFMVLGYENNGTQNPGHSGQAFTLGGGATGILLENMMVTNNGSSGGNPAIAVLDNTEVTLRGGGSFCNLYNTSWTGGVEAFGDGITLNIENYIIGYNFKANSFDGGGLLISGSGSISGTTVNVSNTRFTTNESSNGGGISQHGGVLNVTDCIIDLNYSGQTSTPTYGGGLRMTGGTATFTRTKFTNNQLGSAGGTLRGGGIGLFSEDDPISLTLNNCYFSGNTAAEGNDLFADVFSGNGVTVTATNTTFSTANYSIFNKDATITLTNCGNPPVGGANTPAVNKVNTTAPSSVPNPTPPFIIGDCASLALPIELSKFQASCSDGNIYITWQTLSEINNKKFILEKSYDGTNFEPISTINGAGNSTTTIDYNFIDKNYKGSICYYRLAQQDYNGKTTWSKIIKLANPCTISAEKKYILYPNPTSKNITADINIAQGEEVKITIYNSIGELVQLIPTSTYQNGIQKFAFDTDLLPSGIYYIHFNIADQKKVEKFIKL